MRIGVVLLGALALGLFIQSRGEVDIQKTNNSPYVDRIRLHSLKQNIGANPTYEHVTLEVIGGAGDPVIVSGWTLSSTYGSVRIPEGVVLFRQGNVDPHQAISLYPGESILFSFGRSPVGVSFRENLCTPLLEKFQTFVPPLANTNSQGVQGFYNDCVSMRSREEGFLLPRWRVFANATSSILKGDNEHTLSLFDETGALVSTVPLTK